MKNTTRLALFGAMVSLAAAPAVLAEVDCANLSAQVVEAVNADGASVLEVVRDQIALHPGCACDIVKAAIQASDASGESVAAIVEAAITTAPEQMAAITRCAIAVAPDASAQVEGVLAKYDALAGDSAKGGKGAFVPTPVQPSAWPNPLDFPGVGEGPSPLSPGALGIVPMWISTMVPPSLAPLPIVPPPVTPPEVTPVILGE